MRKTTNKVLTLVFGDLHIGDEGFRLRLWQKMNSNFIKILRAEKPDKIILISLGDVVAGTSIYPGQELDNIVGRGHWQVSVATELFLRLIGEIRKYSKVPLDVHLIKGHHDKTRHVNLAIDLHKELRGWSREYDYNIYYDSVKAIINIGATKKPFKLLCMHGFGSGSKYYPISYSMINDAKDFILSSKEKVDAIITGHFHWFSSVRFRWGGPNGIKWFTIGSYQTYEYREQAQLKYGIASPPSGTWVFINGNPIEMELSMPVPKYLEFKNYEYVAGILKKYLRRLEKSNYIEEE